jgi:methylmalonyl-CoA mutase
MRGYPAKEQISGAIFWNKMPANFTEISASAKSVSHFYPFGFHVVSHNESDIEIAQALKNAVSFINDAVGKGIAPHQIFNQISFSVEIGTDFFKEIATLKALRFLWYQIGGAYGISKQEPLHIHAKSSRWINEHYQPHGNMIKSTTSGMAAVLGGCDSLTIEPEDITNSMMNRIARNVSSVIKEESHFSKVADATDGSHYLDSLTEQLSEKAWKIFQSMVNA